MDRTPVATLRQVAAGTDSPHGDAVGVPRSLRRRPSKTFNRGHIAPQELLLDRVLPWRASPVWLPSPAGRLRQRRQADNPVVAGTITDLLRQGGADRAAVVVPEGPILSHGRLRQLVTEGAEALASLGVGAHDRVAMALPNGAEAIVLF